MSRDEGKHTRPVAAGDVWESRASRGCYCAISPLLDARPRERGLVGKLLS